MYLISVSPRLIIQLPESSPTPKIEILDDPQNAVSKSGDLSNVVQHGEKERKEEEVAEEKDDKSERKEKKSLLKKLLGCFSCCVRSQKEKELVT